MDCPNCGVYNPEEREICWRCDQPLPKPEEPKKRPTDPSAMMRRMWLVIAIVLIVWILLSWILPWLLGGGAPPGP
jgi:predicted nucleic acid-binding Zn ribbon protein